MSTMSRHCEIKNFFQLMVPWSGWGGTLFRKGHVPFCWFQITQNKPSCSQGILILELHSIFNHLHSIFNHSATIDLLCLISWCTYTFHQVTVWIVPMVAPYSVSVHLAGLGTTVPNLTTSVVSTLAPTRQHAWTSALWRPLVPSDVSVLQDLQVTLSSKLSEFTIENTICKCVFSYFCKLSH